MHHLSPKRRKPATATALMILLAFGLALAAIGLAACGGSSSSTPTPAAANAAATGASTSGTNTSATNTTTSGTSTIGTTTTSGGTQSTSTAPASTTPAAAAPAPSGRPNGGHFTAVRECLQKDGITFPGSGNFFGGRGSARLPKGMTRAQFTEALKKCGGGVGGARGGHFGHPLGAFNSPRFRQALAQFTACLRQNGINVPAPNTSGKGPVFDTKGINTSSPQFRAASMKCRGALLAGLRSKASGAGGGA
jgi:hypothetical protein